MKDFNEKIEEDVKLPDDSFDEEDRDDVDEEDRSAFNCTACKGEGLDEKVQRCSVCLGTGKV